MELTDIIRGEQYLNTFSALSSRHKYKDLRETANKLIGFAYNYFFELKDNKKILEKIASPSKKLLYTKWSLSDADKNISNIAQLIADHDRIFREAKQVYKQFSNNHERRDKLGLGYVSCLNDISKSLEHEFSQLISSAKHYYN